MSEYTDLEHEYALESNLYWMQHPPKSPKEKYEYGNYLYGLKDYKEAVTWLKGAADEGDMHALYAYAFCLLKQQGIHGRIEEAKQLFKKVYSFYQVNQDKEDNFYRLGMLYAYGLGVEKNEEIAIQYFQKAAKNGSTKIQGAVFFEIALFYRDGKGACLANIDKARKYLRKSYDAHYEEAIFTDYELFQDEFEKYEYIREIKEAFSFRLGQYMRVAELRKSRESLLNLIHMYQKGYPGDCGKKKEEFIKKADKYMKMLESISD